MFYAPKHAQPRTVSTARRRLAGVTIAGATMAAGSVASAGSASAGTVWDRVAQCESGGNWRINTGNGFYGGLQFHPQTWRGYGGGQYAAYAHQASKAQQIAIAKKVLRSQGPGAWPVCSRRAGLTRANGLAGSSGSTSTRTTSTASRSSLRSGAIPVTGVKGARTYAGIERWVGGSVNGSLSRTDKVKLQAKLGVARDGIIGPQTTRALQRRVGATPDGVWGPQTTRALQRYLNRVL